MRGKSRIGRVADKWRAVRAMALGMLVALPLSLIAVLPAQAQLLPREFFDNVPTPGGPARVEADVLAYDSKADVITASGRVIMHYSGYTMECDNLHYTQKTGALICVGDVSLTSPDGGVMQSDRVEVTGGMKEAFVTSLTLKSSNGAMVTARDAHYGAELERVLTDATYSPCGLCVDNKGNKIGWKVRAAKLTQNPVTKEVKLESPMLEVLGMPIAWLPWLSLPDPSSPRTTGVRLPSVDYSSQRGAVLKTPYFVGVGEDTDILFTPQLMSRQGVLLGAEWAQRFDYGSFDLSASGLYQLDKSAFAGEVGERDWRGAVQTSGHFTPYANWTAGWSYTAFTDAGYLDDYDFNNDDYLTNEIYATELSPDTYADVRVQQFLMLGNYTVADQRIQALTVPNARFDDYYNDDQLGQFKFSGSLLGVQREDDHLATIGSTNYVFGYSGEKIHGTVEASWQKQYITSSGVVLTPFAGLRADAASFDGDGSPLDETRFGLTPILALDARLPLLSTDGANSFLIEPIAQVAYRATDTTLPGITNDNAHSFVLDETNLFDFDRFSGSDRQETGLMANIGARYLATLADGRWLEVSAGQSYHLSGVNGMDVVDETNLGASTGLNDDASYFVVGARGSPSDGTTVGAKLQIDPNDARIARAGLGGDVALNDGVSLGGDYIYLPKDAALGVADDQHEVTVRGKVPLPMDYWSATGSLSWDLAAGEWLEATGEVTYDDGYFLAGAFAKATGATNTSPDDFSVGVKFRLKAPDGQDAF